MSKEELIKLLESLKIEEIINVEISYFKENRPGFGCIKPITVKVGKQNGIMD